MLEFMEKVKNGDYSDVITSYNNGCRIVWDAFLLKHGFVDDESGKIYDYYPLFNNEMLDKIEVSDYILDIGDALYDLKNNIGKGQFFNWYDYTMFQGLNDYPFVSYRSYLRGYRNKQRSKFMEICLSIKRDISFWFYRIKNRDLYKEFEDKLKDSYEN